MMKIDRYIPHLVSFVFIFYGLFFVNNLPLSGPPDELAHVSYILDATNSNIYLPDYKNGKVIGGSELNFLSHPPLYYSTQAVWGELMGLNAEVDFKGYRLLSLFMVALGMFFILKTAQSLGLSNGFLLLLGLGVVAVPNFTYIASSVNNDNLVFLSVALLFSSIVAISKAGSEKGNTIAVIGIYLSLTIIALTKVNAALFAITFFLSWLFFTKGKFLFELFRSKRWIGLVFSSIFVFSYYSYAFIEYGSFFPSPRYVYQLTTPDHPMSFGSYLVHFFILLITRFSGAYGHVSYLVYPSNFVNGLYFLLLSPFLIYFGFRLFLKSLFCARTEYRVFDAVFLGFVVLLLTHVYMGYAGYLATGIVAAVQPRYYLFLIPLVWVPAFILAQHHKLIERYRIIFSTVILILVPVSVSYSAVGLVQAKLNPVNGVYMGDLSSIGSKYPASLPLVQRKLGNLDLIKILDDRVLMVGWSFDQKLNQASRAILVFYKNIQIARFELNVVRPDVSRQFKSINANNSGFRFSVPSSSDANLCEYDILAEFEGGTYSVLSDGGC